MNAIFSIVALVFVGAGAALGWQSFRHSRMARANSEDIDRWEEEGGHLLPARRSAAGVAANSASARDRA
jgi:hypothetical protein